MIIENAKQLVSKVKTYNPDIDEAIVGIAFDFAQKAHHGQIRASGEPYFTHPVEVAEIVAEMRLDQSTIITALLHDVVEDTGVTLDTIRAQFDEEIARLVDGVTKLTRIEMQSDNRQAENFRKLVLAMSEDIRVLIVKLADRTHNMRTIDYIPRADKRERIAQETLAIFAPLAERMGLTHFQHELEDRAFAVLNPKGRESIITRMDYLASASGSDVTKIKNQLHKTLKKENLESEVSGRQKTPYSIWRKMQRQKVEMEELSDIMAFRIVVDGEEECYRALGIIHRGFKAVPGRFKDYISTPKRNRYQSLHTCVIGPLKKKIEIQIRTREMYEVAEHGVAAHWIYKDDAASIKVEEAKQIKWLNDLVNVLDNAASPDEFLEHTQMEMYADQVFCFTPKGALIALPKESTAVDFAYAVHSDMGDTCVAVKINGKTRQLATILNNGDQVEVTTSKSGNPNPEWENFVKTGRAKSAIRRFVRLERQKEFSVLGKALVNKIFRQAKCKLKNDMMVFCLAYFNVNTDDELYAKVGENLIDPNDILRYLYPDASDASGAPGAKTPKSKKTTVTKKQSLDIKGLVPGMAVHIGKCCHPLPGERIIGIITTGKGLTVHRVDCQNLEKFSAMPELWVDIQWGHEQSNIVSARLKAVLINAPGSLAEVATLISQNHGNIANIQLTARDPDFFTLLIDVEVNHLRQMTAILAALRANYAVDSIEREKS